MSDLIVVPLDGSKNAENALPWAATLARLYNATVEFVHVIDDDGVEDPRDLSAATATFASHASELANKWGLPAHDSRVLQGHPARTIVDVAAGARFIVIASHGHGGFRAAFVGSVADKVIRNATVPALLVPAIGAPVAPDGRTVLVALDGSEAAESGLELARDLARRLKSTVTLLRAWTFLVQATGTFDSYYPSQEVFEAVELAAKEYIAAKALPGEAAVVVMGPAVAAVGDVAARLDPELVVVTTSGKGFAARIALGSTTERLAHSLHRPLLIVPVAGRGR
ncbi:MAG: universal stress protein [Anaerolineaceae bacterium]